MSEGPRLSIIPARACTDPALKPRDLQVLCVLGRHTDNLGWCEKSQVKMAEEMGCARSTVFAAIERLVQAGYLERHVQPQENGRDAPHLYRVILDPRGQPEAFAEPFDGGDTPADIPAPPAAISAPPAGSGPAPKNDPFRTIEREGARAKENSEQPDNGPPEDRPGTAAFEKRALRFCSGAGYLAGQWPNWDKGASPKWIFAQFAALSPEERAEAERWRDAYVFDLAHRKIPASKVMGVGNFFNGRVWQGLDPAILDRVEKAKQATLKPEDRPRPDGWAAMLGPVGMAWFIAKMLEGPQAGSSPLGVVWSDAQLRETWPAAAQFQAVLREKGGVVFAERWHAAARLMEAPPAGSIVLAAWKAGFAQRGWPWFAAFDNARAVWLPKVEPPGDGIGPPDMMAAIGRALDAFEAAVKAETGKGDEDDGDRREAAE